MKTSTKYSVSDAATLYKKSRATLYKDIKNGVLSRDHDGFIDFSELLRVYGEPFSGKQPKRIDTPQIQNLDTGLVLKRQQISSTRVEFPSFLYLGIKNYR